MSKDNGVKLQTSWSDDDDITEDVVNRENNIRQQTTSNNSAYVDLIRSRCISNYNSDDLFSMDMCAKKQGKAKSKNKSKVQLDKSSLDGFRVVSVMVPGIAINDTMEQEPQLIQMTIPLNGKHGKHIVNYVNGEDPDAPEFNSDNYKMPTQSDDDDEEGEEKEPEKIYSDLSESSVTSSD